MTPDWQQRYESGDTPWDKGGPHPALAKWLEKSPLTGRVLVPGCGAGHDVRALAAAGARATGLDIAPLAVEAARRFPRAGDEIYVAGDVFALPPEWLRSFDAVFEHTCFCAIDPMRRPDYARAVGGALKPGGHLLAIFYLDPGNGGEGPPFGCAREELDALFLPLFETIREESGFVTFPGREGGEMMRVLRRR